MRLLFLSVLITIGYINPTCMAQVGSSSMNIFSEDGNPFVLILNGQQYNQKAQTSVTVDNLNSVPYKLRVIFSDTALGALNDKINLQIGYLQTYVIKKKKVSALEKSVKHLGNDISYGFNTKDPAEAQKRREEIENERSRFVIRMLSATAMAAPPPPQSAPPPQQNTNTRNTATGNSGQTTTHTTVQSSNTSSQTRVNSGTSAGSTNISMNISLNETGGNANYSETTTTTTTTTSHPATTQQNVYVMPGYSGPTGCPWPMSDGDFSRAKSSVSSKSFEDSKLTLAKQIFDHNCLLSSQVKEIILLFDFENTRLDFAKYAYGRTYDIGNYYVVNDAFDFESSISELNQYIQSRGR